MGFFYSPASCFDGRQNADERGVDCGGSCTRICAADVAAPTVNWARSFMVTASQYNAVAYIENTNTLAASPEIPYTFKLYDADGLIAERSGVTILPPDSVYPIFADRIDTNGRVPTQTILELGEATIWIPATGGRDQFLVNSRSLSGADSRPRLTANISNNALTAARNVEVVATIFDARGNALTASRTFVDEFSPRSTKEVVFTWPGPIAKTIRSCEVPTDIVLGIDLSGSMNNDNDSPPEPISAVITAARAFVERLRSSDQSGIVTFASEAVLVTPLTNDLLAVATTVGELRIDPAEERGSTNTGDAIYRATEELTSSRHNDAARKVLVILTDGLATAPNENPSDYALTAAAAARAAGIDVYAIGLGVNVDMDFVQALASSPGQAFAAVSARDVDRIYQNITADLCEDGAAVIEIIPKSNANFSTIN